jgi:hypothetical protein
MSTLAEVLASKGQVVGEPLFELYRERDYNFFRRGCASG